MDWQVVELTSQQGVDHDFTHLPAASKRGDLQVGVESI
jgi:hypothetical protein